MVADTNIQKPPPKKRGRKSKKTLEEEKKLGIYKEKTEPKIPKKRGRKPKGGKVINKNATINHVIKNTKPNIILHLKCNTSELKNSYFISNTEYNPHIESIESYNIPNSQKTLDLKFDILLKVLIRK